MDLPRVHACLGCGHVWSLSGPPYCPICDCVDVRIVEAVATQVRPPTAKLRLVGFSPIQDETSNA